MACCQLVVAWAIPGVLSVNVTTSLDHESFSRSPPGGNGAIVRGCAEKKAQAVTADHYIATRFGNWMLDSRAELQ